MTMLNPNALVTAGMNPELREVLRSALMLEKLGCRRYEMRVDPKATSDAFVRGFLKRWEDNRVCLTRKGLYYASLLAA